MNRKLNRLALTALATLLPVSMIAAVATAAPLSSEPTAEEEAPAVTLAVELETATPAVGQTPEATFVVDPPDDCDLQCHREFTACRQAAGNSGGPNFPAAAFEACVDELEYCLAHECGIGC